MGDHWWSWIREKTERTDKVQPARSPCLEQLEPRLLLSVDLVGSEPLEPLHPSLDEPAIYANLDQPKESLQSESSPVLMTFIVSDGQAPEASSDLSTSACLQGQEESILAQPLTATLQPVATETATTESLVGTALANEEQGTGIVDSQESTSLVQEVTACGICVDSQEHVSSEDMSSIGARGPPAAAAGDLLAVTQDAFIFDMAAGFDHIFLRLNTADGGEKLQITDAAGTILAEAPLVSTSSISIYGQADVG